MKKEEEDEKEEMETKENKGKEERGGGRWRNTQGVLGLLKI